MVTDEDARRRNAAYMNVVFTILIGFVVLITALLFAGFSMCALGGGVPAGTRATLLLFGLAFGGDAWRRVLNGADKSNQRTARVRQRKCRRKRDLTFFTI